MPPSGRRGHAALPALLTALLVALAALPVVLTFASSPCPDCRGADLGRRTFVRKGGYCRTPVASIRCPRCLDRGTVRTLGALLGPELGPGLADLIRAERDPYRRDLLVKLDSLVRRDGRDPAAVCGWPQPPELPQGWARFVRSDGKDYVLALFYSDTRPGPVRGGALLLDLRGRVLDHLAFEGVPGRSYVLLRFAEDSGPDGAVATAAVRAIEPGPLGAWTLHSSDGSTIHAPTGGERGIARRIGIAGSRLAFLDAAAE